MNRLLGHPERETVRGRLYQYATALLCGELVRVDDTKPELPVSHHIEETWASHYSVVRIPELNIGEVAMQWQDHPTANWVSTSWRLAERPVYQHQDPAVMLLVNGGYHINTPENLRGSTSIYAHNTAEYPNLGDTPEAAMEAMRTNSEAWAAALRYITDQDAAEARLRELSLPSVDELVPNIITRIAAAHGLEPLPAFIARQEAIEAQEDLDR